MTWTAFALAVLALLASPGPTNTLLFLAGGERRAAAALTFVPVVVLAYLAVLVPLSLIGSRVSGLVPVVCVLSGLWVARMAWRLWRQNEGRPQGAVTLSGVVVTTLLNPKGVIIGLGLLTSAPSLPVATALCAAIVAVVSTVWVVAGAVTAGSGKDPARRMLWVRRGSALWLGALSLGLLARGLTA